MFTCPAQATRRPARSSSETDVILRWRNIAGCRFSILDAVVLCPKKCAGAGHNSQCREDCDRDKKRKLCVEESAASAILECGTLCSRASMKICNKVHATGSIVLYRSGWFANGHRISNRIGPLQQGVQYWRHTAVFEWQQVINFTRPRPAAAGQLSPYTTHNSFSTSFMHHTIFNTSSACHKIGWSQRLAQAGARTKEK